MKRFIQDKKGLRLWTLCKFVKGERGLGEGDVFIRAKYDFLDDYVYRHPSTWVQNIQRWRDALKNQYFYMPLEDEPSRFKLLCDCVNEDGRVCSYEFDLFQDQDGDVFISDVPLGYEVGSDSNWVDVKSAYRKQRGH